MRSFSLPFIAFCSKAFILLNEQIIFDFISKKWGSRPKIVAIQDVSTKLKHIQNYPLNHNYNYIDQKVKASSTSEKL